MHECVFKRHPRARRFRITVHAGGRCVVTMPPRATERGISRFMRQNESWLIAARNQMRALPTLPRSSRAEYIRHKEKARALVHEKISTLNVHYRVSIGRISIRNQKTCWGSCSGKGNVNFNYRLLFMPKEVSEYVVAHELCHIKEFNHSARFWALVAETIPDYRRIRRELNQWGGRLSL